MTYLAHARVEPLPELFALIRIIDQAGHWLEDDVHASKALKEGSKFGCSRFETTVVRRIQVQSTRGRD